MNFLQVWLEGEPCHCSRVYRAAHYSKTCSNYKRAGFSCWLLQGILLPGSSPHRQTAPHLTKGATAGISFLLPVLMNMQWSPAAEWAPTGKIKWPPVHNTLWPELRELNALTRRSRLQPGLPTPFMSAPMVELVQKLGAVTPCWPVSCAA